MGDLLAIIVFVANFLFFMWFGTTLNSIKRHLGDIAEHAERQTKMLAVIANVPVVEPRSPAAEPSRRRGFLSDDTTGT
jgi:hypothetical protein